VARDLRDQPVLRLRAVALRLPAAQPHAASAIVNVGSVSGLTHVRTGAAYGMSKAALHQLTKNLACDGPRTACA
jgi:NAD(P)-dependent dehydrogenase (short-subunit alcohol dehydrogenase family)